MRYNFDVLSVRKQGEVCSITTEYVSGQTLEMFLKKHKDITKEKCYEWFLELIRQLQIMENLGDAEAEKKVSIYHIVVKDDDTLAFVDLRARVNQKYLHTVMGNPNFQKFSLQPIWGLKEILTVILTKTNLLSKFQKKEISKLKQVMKKNYKSLSGLEKDICLLKCSKKKVGRWVFLLVLFLVLFTKNFVSLKSYEIKVPEVRGEVQSVILKMREICQNGELKKEEKEELLTRIVGEQSEVLATERFKMLQQEYGIYVKGERIWLER